MMIQPKLGRGGPTALARQAGIPYDRTRSNIIGETEMNVPSLLAYMRALDMTFHDLADLIEILQRAEKKPANAAVETAAESILRAKRWADQPDVAWPGDIEDARHIAQAVLDAVGWEPAKR